MQKSRVAFVVALLGGLVVLLSRQRSPPLPIVRSTLARVDVRQCADCHDTIYRSLQSAPHSVTLRRPTDSEALLSLFAGKDASIVDDLYRFEERDGALYVSSDRFPTTLKVDWIFGSGHHALTPVSTVENPRGATELFQLNVSWLPGHGLGITPGTITDSEVPSLGLHHSEAETENCFGCHSSLLPVEGGRIDFERLVAGVNCTRCHFGTVEHMQSSGERGTTNDWQSLSPLESINRCGECHRRLDEFTADELVPSNQLLIRFAPVGLSQSRCFQSTLAASSVEGERRLDCLTCHDPHRSAETDPHFYDQVCRACHDQLSDPSAPICSAAPMTTSCLGCHMPKVSSSKELAFTDHWIRVRGEEALAREE